MQCKHTKLDQIELFLSPPQKKKTPKKNVNKMVTSYPNVYGGGVNEMGNEHMETTMTPTPPKVQPQTHKQPTKPGRVDRVSRTEANVRRDILCNEAALRSGIATAFVGDIPLICVLTAAVPAAETIQREALQHSEEILFETIVTEATLLGDSVPELVKPSHTYLTQGRLQMLKHLYTEKFAEIMAEETLQRGAEEHEWEVEVGRTEFWFAETMGREVVSVLWGRRCDDMKVFWNQLHLASSGQHGTALETLLASSAQHSAAHSTPPPLTPKPPPSTRPLSLLEQQVTLKAQEDEERYQIKKDATLSHTNLLFTDKFAKKVFTKESYQRGLIESHETENYEETEKIFLRGVRRLKSNEEREQRRRAYREHEILRLARGPHTNTSSKPQQGYTSGVSAHAIYSAGYKNIAEYMLCESLRERTMILNVLSEHRMHQRLHEVTEQAVIVQSFARSRLAGSMKVALNISGLTKIADLFELKYASVHNALLAEGLAKGATLLGLETWERVTILCDHVVCAEGQDRALLSKREECDARTLESTAVYFRSVAHLADPGIDASFFSSLGRTGNYVICDGAELRTEDVD